MDPLKPLRTLPQATRAYYYRLAASALALLVALDVLLVEQLDAILRVLEAALGLGAATLAAANTPTSKPPRTTVRAGDPVPDNDPTTTDR